MRYWDKTRPSLENQINAYGFEGPVRRGLVRQAGSILSKHEASEAYVDFVGKWLYLFIFEGPNWVARYALQPLSRPSPAVVTNRDPADQVILVPHYFELSFRFLMKPSGSDEAFRELAKSFRIRVLQRGRKSAMLGFVVEGLEKIWSVHGAWIQIAAMIVTGLAAIFAIIR